MNAHEPAHLQSSGSNDLSCEALDFVQRQVLEGHWSAVEDVIELGGDYAGLICSTSSDKSTRIWLDSTKTDIVFQPELILRGHSLPVTSVVQLDDGRICTGSKDSLIKIWDPSKNWTTGQCDKTMRGHKKGINILKILTRVDNLSCLCSGADDFTIMVWDLQLFRYICVLEGHSGPISDVIELRNGNLCSASTDHSLIVWATIPGIARAAGADKLHKSSSFAVSDGSSGSKRETSSVKLRMSAAQQLLQRASAVQGELYRLERTLVTRGHKGPVRCVVELADGRLCSCGDDKVLKFWDPVRLVCDLTMEGHWAAVNCVLQLRSGLLCSCSDDRTIKLWHLHRYTKKNISTPDDHCVRTLTGHSGVVRRVRELRDGSLCSCSGDNKIILWTPRQPSESP